MRFKSMSHRIFMLAVVNHFPVSFTSAILRSLSIVLLAGAMLLTGCDRAPAPAAVNTNNSRNGDDGAGDDGSSTQTSNAPGNSAPQNTPRNRGNYAKNPAPPPPVTGSFNVYVRGDFTGTGSGSVSTTAISISGQMKDANGNPGSFSINLPVTNLRFAGTANVMGMTVNVNGRIDPADNSAMAGSVLRNARLVGTMATSNGSAVARFAGQPAGAATYSGSSGH